MATRPQDLTVARSDVGAETIAAFIWDAAHGRLPEGNSAIAESIRRSAKRHARELLDLHEIKADEVLPAGTTAWTPQHVQVEG